MAAKTSSCSEQLSALLWREQMRHGVTNAVERVQCSLHNISCSGASQGREAIPASQGVEEGFSKRGRLSRGGTQALPKSTWAPILKLHAITFPTDPPESALAAHLSHLPFTTGLSHFRRRGEIFTPPESPHGALLQGWWASHRFNKGAGCYIGGWGGVLSLRLPDALHPLHKDVHLQ